MARYLGVDGGGSKTAFALIDQSGQILSRAQAPSCYYFNVGFDIVEVVLRQGIQAICEEAAITPADITHAFFGLPGYGEASADIEQLDNVPAEVLGHRRYHCDNDMVCGWAGSLGGADGINVICGTGSMTYGERDGLGRRVGGWGELFGDEGSAYWIAERGLNAFSRMSDHRLTRGALYDLMRERLAVTDDLDIVGLVIDQWKGDRSTNADLSKVVCRAAEVGDQAAQQILAQAADELATLVNTTRELVGFGSRDRVLVSYSGGMFTADGFLPRFEQALARHPAEYELRKPAFDPALGAALYAAMKSGHPLTDPSLAALTATANQIEVPDP